MLNAPPQLCSQAFKKNTENSPLNIVDPTFRVTFIEEGKMDVTPSADDKNIDGLQSKKRCAIV